MTAIELELIFPNLKYSDYSITSPSTPSYNCIAWAANDDKLWWWPDPYGQYYWPPFAARECNLQAFMQVFGLFGYESCEDAGLEPGFEKVAIYVDRNGKPTHAARQLSSGQWTSKLGNLEDIAHSLSDIENKTYGKAAQILKRPKPTG